ncbi:hypothetical protein POTOM_029530 [Populus tomentosa]|uniref:Cytosolic endo-beta-N-acetylglucosaminidase TIM barrel domain-containing protein n=1 Tax=Populus tomentosa TaxID=118781 RepID=A0A8X8CJR7_POPTO|nr:hypothetical protein POTOM_029530 [Populus tomentosa]
MKSAPMNAERLAELAVDLGFDGWLINMEVSLHKQQIPNLEEFVSHLTHAMDSLMPESLVIRYDSVITTGYIWWMQLHPTLYTDFLSTLSLSNHVIPLLVVTDHCQGYRVSVEGNQLTDAPLNNMSCQGFQGQPDPMSVMEVERLVLSLLTSRFQMLFNSLLNDSNAPFSVRFSFKESFFGQPTSPPCILSVMNERIRALAAPSEMHGLFHKFSGVIMPHQDKVYTAESQSEFGVDNQDTALDPSPAEYFAVLGHFTFKKLPENFFPPSTAWLTESQ